MAAHDYDIGVIGAGAAGLTVASGCSQLGAKTLLVEKESALGGDCLHYGCVPSKTLIRSAQVYHQARSMARFGLPQPEVSRVEFRHVAERIQGVIRTIQEHDSVERFCDLGVQVEFGEPLFADDHSIRLNGKTVSARRWVVATGSSPAVPDIEGLDRTPYLTNREIFSLPELPASLIILGAGSVATEMAQAFARLGTEVHVLQRSGQILSREDTDMAEGVRQCLEREGVRFYLRVAVQSVRDLGGEREVRFTDDSGEERSLRSERLLVALGREANVGELALDRAGVEHTRKGIPVDERMRTSQSHIYAAGDVTGRHLFTHAAGYEGGIIVSNAAFHIPRKADYTYMPRCTYTDPEFAVMGVTEKQALEEGRKYEVWTESFRGNDRSLAEGEEYGWIKMLLARSGRPLGVQILGPRAGELLSEWVAVLGGGVKLTTLASAVHPYPTLAEVNKSVAGNYLQPKIFSKRMTTALSLLFNFKGRACKT